MLLKIQLETIKLIEVKQLQNVNFIKRTHNMLKKSHTQPIEEPNNKVEELIRAMEMLILGN